MPYTPWGLLAFAPRLILPYLPIWTRKRNFRARFWDNKGKVARMTKNRERA